MGRKRNIDSELIFSISYPPLSELTTAQNYGEEHMKAIAKEIVEAHKGQILCESRVGEGTTFTLILPVSVQNRRRSSPQRAVATEVES